MRRDSGAGFTLLEVMVAFLIAALATVVLLHAGFDGALEDDIAAHTDEAVSRAQSRLASFGVLTPLRAASLAGDDGGGFAWRVRISPLQTIGGLTLYRIDLTESFRGGRLVLTTERLAPTK